MNRSESQRPQTVNDLDTVMQSCLRQDCINFMSLKHIAEKYSVTEESIVDYIDDNPQDFPLLESLILDKTGIVQQILTDGQVLNPRSATLPKPLLHLNDKEAFTFCRRFKIMRSELSRLEELLCIGYTPEAIHVANAYNLEALRALAKAIKWEKSHAKMDLPPLIRDHQVQERFAPRYPQTRMLPSSSPAAKPATIKDLLFQLDLEYIQQHLSIAQETLLTVITQLYDGHPIHVITVCNNLQPSTVQELHKHIGRHKGWFHSQGELGSLSKAQAQALLDKRCTQKVISQKAGVSHQAVSLWVKRHGKRPPKIVRKGTAKKRV